VTVEVRDQAVHRAGQSRQVETYYNTLAKRSDGVHLRC